MASGRRPPGELGLPSFGLLTHLSRLKVCGLMTDDGTTEMVAYGTVDEVENRMNAGSTPACGRCDRGVVRCWRSRRSAVGARRGRLAGAVRPGRRSQSTSCPAVPMGVFVFGFLVRRCRWAASLGVAWLTTLGCAVHRAGPGVDLVAADTTSIRPARSVPA